jgi:hypothetical protein
MISDLAASIQATLLVTLAPRKALLGKVTYIYSRVVIVSEMSFI